MRLDHLIATVPDIWETHARLMRLGFETAWPPGPFWPEATTSGIALGGANLELVQPEAGVDEARIETLVLAPASLDEGYEMPLRFEERSKVEPDSRLLVLRGFPPEMCEMPQPICDNLYPLEGEADYPFFLCQYAPFLRARLAPENFTAPRGPLTGLTLRAPHPETVRRLFAGRLGPIGLDVDPGEGAEVAEIRFADGSSLSAKDL